MGNIIAVFRKGRIELEQPVDWPDGTTVRVTPIGHSGDQVSWLSLPPLDVGAFQEVSASGDLLAEMLDDSRD